jgi:hypothetical protein
MVRAIWTDFIKTNGSRAEPTVVTVELLTLKKVFALSGEGKLFVVRKTAN